MKNTKLIIVLTVLLSANVFGQQDVHFSQFFSSPLTLNPANAGIFNGDLRAIMNYRSQWGTVSKSYATTAASVDMPVLKEMAGGMFGLGVNFFKDNAGSSQFSSANYAISLAYHLDISGGKNNHFLSIGFQGGIVQKSIAYNNLTWDNQWNGSGFDQQIAPANIAEIGGTSSKALDLSTGLHWYYAPSANNRFFGGASLFHFNRPDVGFNSESKLLSKLTIHGGAEFQIGEGMAITPNFVNVSQGANTYTDIGGEFKYFISENSKFTNHSREIFISAGPYYRFNDAAYIVARFGWSGMIASISYDFNVSDLSNASGGTGGVEIMLGYKMDLSKTATRGHNIRFK